MQMHGQKHSAKVLMESIKCLGMTLKHRNVLCAIRMHTMATTVLAHHLLIGDMAQEFHAGAIAK